MKHIKWCLYIFCMLLAVPTMTWAQEEPPVFKLAVDVDLVELHVSVVDDKDRPVSGLTKDNFRILENTISQNIAVFKHEDMPVSLGLVIDNSRSIEPRKQRLDAAALAFVRKSNPDDETFVVHFDFDARLAQGFTGDTKVLEKTLANTKPFGQTALYDAVIVALEQMEKAQYQKKALLVISDGLDNMSKHTLAQAIEKTKQSRVAVYTVGLLSATDGEKAEQDLIKLAEASGGRAYFPQNVDEARTMMETIARDLREQYTLGYFPSASKDGSWRSVRVEVLPPPGFPQKLTANYRRGYYASGTGPHN